MIGDLPVSGKIATVNLQVRNSFVKIQLAFGRFLVNALNNNSKATQEDFNCSTNFYHQLGLELRGNVAQRVGKQCFVRSKYLNDSSINHQMSNSTYFSSLNLGFDDWTFKKRMKYGTIIVDLEKNKVIELLPDREEKTLSRWLEQHLSIR